MKQIQQNQRQFVPKFGPLPQVTDKKLVTRHNFFKIDRANEDSKLQSLEVRN